MTGALSRRGLLWTGVAFGLSGCASTPILTPSTPADTWPELEPLLSVRTGHDALTIGVLSRGCAAKSDFVFRVDRSAGRAVIAFARRRLETCKGPASPVAFAFSYDELGLKAGERIVIANAVSPSA